MKAILSLIISGALVVSGYAQTRNVLVGTNNSVVQPTNFWSADASNARAGLGLGETNSPQLNRLIVGNGSFSSPAIQIGTNAKGLAGSSGVLFLVSGGVASVSVTSNSLAVAGSIVVGDAAATRTNFGLVWEGLTNADATSFRTALGLGTAATNAASAFQASSVVLSNLASSNGVNLTNLQATNLVGVIPSSNIATVNFSNLAGTLSIASGGTGATNATNARQNLGSTTVGDALFTATNASSARTTIGALATNGDATNLTNFPALLLRTNGSASGLTNFPTVPLASNVAGTIAISNGGSGATNAGGARTNLGLGATNDVAFQNIFLDGGQLSISNSGIYWFGNLRYEPETQTFQGTVQIENGAVAIIGTNAALNIATTRTNLGLGWPALTNTTASGFQAALFGTGTNPVLASTNGEVVSPTNFWQVSPANTRVQLSQPNGATNSVTNTATNARNLYLYSLTTNVFNTTNTILLPTNGGTLLGDVATVIHEGPTSSITAVRQTGAGSNLITLNQFQETVKFIYESGGWRLADNLSFIEPIYFSGTNAEANAAASRMNLGLGATWLTNTNVTNFRAAIGLGATNNVTFNSLALGGGTNTALFIADEQTILGDGVLYFEAGQIIFNTPIEFNNTTNAATTRTNFGLPLAALTNTNAAGFQRAIFTTNAAPTNSANINTVNFNTAVAWMEVSVITNGATNSYRIPLFQ